MVACVSLVVDGNVHDPCADAGGTFQARLATLTRETPSVPSIAAGIGVCDAELTVLVADLGVSQVPVLVVC